MAFSYIAGRTALGALVPRVRLPGSRGEFEHDGANEVVNDAAHSAVGGTRSNQATPGDESDADSEGYGRETFANEREGGTCERQECYGDDHSGAFSASISAVTPVPVLVPSGEVGIQVLAQESVESPEDDDSFFAEFDSFETLSHRQRNLEEAVESVTGTLERRLQGLSENAAREAKFQKELGESLAQIKQDFREATERLGSLANANLEQREHLSQLKDDQLAAKTHLHDIVRRLWDFMNERVNKEGKENQTQLQALHSDLQNLQGRYKDVTEASKSVDIAVQSVQQQLACLRLDVNDASDLRRKNEKDFSSMSERVRLHEDKFDSIQFNVDNALNLIKKTGDKAKALMVEQEVNLEVQIDSVQQEVNSIKGAIKKNVSDIRNLTAERDLGIKFQKFLGSRIDGFVEDSTRCEKNLQAMEMALTTMGEENSSRYQELRGRIDSLAQLLGSCEGDAAKGLSAVEERVQKLVGELDRAISDLLGEIEHRHETLSSAILELQNRLDAQKQEDEKLNKAVGGLIDSAGSQYEELVSNIQSLQSQLHAQRRAENVPRMNEHGELKAAIRDILGAAESKSEEHASSIQSLQNELNALKEASRDTRKKGERFEQDQNIIEQHLATNTSKLSELDVSIDALKSQLNAQKEAQEMQNAELDVTKQKYNKILGVNGSNLRNLASSIDFVQRHLSAWKETQQEKDAEQDAELEVLRQRYDARVAPYFGGVDLAIRSLQSQLDAQGEKDDEYNANLKVFASNIEKLSCQVESLHDQVDARVVARNRAGDVAKDVRLLGNVSNAQGQDIPYTYEDIGSLQDRLNEIINTASESNGVQARINEDAVLEPESLKNDLAEIAKRVTAVEGIVSSTKKLNNEMAETKQRLEETIGQLEAVKSERDIFKLELLAMKGDLEDLKKHHDELDREENARHRHLLDLVNNQSTRQTSLSAAFREAKRDLDTMKGEWDTSVPVDDDIKALKDEGRKLREALSNVREEMQKDKQARAKECQWTLANLREEVQRGKTARHELEKNYNDNLQTLIDEANRNSLKVASLYEGHRNSNSSVDELKEQLTRAQAGSKDAAKEIPELKRAVELLLAWRERVEATQADFHARILLTGENLRVLSNVVDQNADSVKAAADAYSNMKDYCKKKFDRTRRRLQPVYDTINHLREFASGLQAEIDELKQSTQEPSLTQAEAYMQLVHTGQGLKELGEKLDKNTTEVNNRLNEVAAGTAIRIHETIRELQPINDTVERLKECTNSLRSELNEVKQSSLSSKSVEELQRIAKQHTGTIKDLRENQNEIASSAEDVLSLPQQAQSIGEATEHLKEHTSGLYSDLDEFKQSTQELLEETQSKLHSLLTRIDQEAKKLESTGVKVNTEDDAEQAVARASDLEQKFKNAEKGRNELVVAIESDPTQWRENYDTLLVSANQANSRMDALKPKLKSVEGEVLASTEGSRPQA